MLSALTKIVVVLLLVAACGRRGFELPGTKIDASGDSTSGGDGQSQIDAEIPVTCGDGVVDPGEDCDTGAASVGCTAGCKLADQGNGGTCAAPVALTLVPSTTGMRAMATGDTSTGVNGAQVSCTPANTLDRVYTVTLATATTLTVTVTPTTWNTAVAVRDAALACTTSTTICCVDAGGAGIAETSPCPVSAGTVMVVVDSGGGIQSGPYTLTLGTP